MGYAAGVTGQQGVKDVCSFCLLCVSGGGWAGERDRQTETERQRQRDRERKTETDRDDRERQTDREGQREADRQRGTERGRQTDRQTETETDRQTDRERQRETERDFNPFTGPTHTFSGLKSTHKGLQRKMFTAYSMPTFCRNALCYEVNLLSR